MELESLVLFSSCLDAMLTHFLSSNQSDDILSQCIDLFQDSVFVFKDLNFTLLVKHIDTICSKTSFQVQASFFKTWIRFMLQKECASAILRFVQASYL